jgi:hypothetical protein
VDFGTFLKKVSSHMKQTEKAYKRKGEEIEYESRVTNVTCFFCPTSNTEPVLASYQGC